MYHSFFQSNSFPVVNAVYVLNVGNDMVWIPLFHPLNKLYAEYFSTNYSKKCDKTSITHT